MYFASHQYKVWFLVFLWLPQKIFAKCYWQQDFPDPTMLPQPKATTAFTYTKSILLTGCDTDPQTFSLVDTAIVKDTSYLGNTNVLHFTLSEAAIPITLTFPSLPVSILTPGEEITIVSPMILKTKSEGR